MERESESVMVKHSKCQGTTGPYEDKVKFVERGRV